MAFFGMFYNTCKNILNEKPMRIGSDEFLLDLASTICLKVGYTPDDIYSLVDLVDYFNTIIIVYKKDTGFYYNPISFLDTILYMNKPTKLLILNYCEIKDDDRCYYEILDALYDNLIVKEFYNQNNNSTMSSSIEFSKHFLFMKYMCENKNFDITDIIDRYNSLVSNNDFDYNMIYSIYKSTKDMSLLHLLDYGMFINILDGLKEKNNE